MSSLTEISRGSFSPSAKRLRISIGMTIRPRSSMWRMIPVFVAPLVDRDPNGRSVVPFDPNVSLPFGCGGLQGTRPRVLPFLTTISGFGAARSHSYDWRE